MAAAVSVTPAQAQSNSDTRGSFDQSHSTKPPPPSAKQLWDWYGEASKLHDQGKVEEAWKVYKRIWEHKQTYDVAASMGEVCAKRGEFALAARYYRFALETVVPTQSPDFVEAVKEELHKALAEVTEVEINVTTAGEQASELHVIDEKTQRELELPLFLEPGNYNLKAQAPGFAPRFKAIAAVPGQVVQWDIDLVRLTPAEAEAARTTKTRHPWLVFGIGGLVTAGLGTTSYLLAREARKEYNAGIELGKGLSPRACLTASQECTQLEAHSDASDRYQKLSWLSAGGAGVAAIATIVTYVLWEDTDPIEVTVERTGTDGWKVGWTHAF
jgi:tetratricopeptide (TPR) repeat protein